MIYLDHAATSPVREEVAQAMLRCLTADGHYANTSSLHEPGRKAAKVLEQARERFAGLVGARPQDIVWTSGATESNNLALLGGAAFHENKGRRIALAKTEHKSVLDPCRQLATQGWRLDWLPTDSEGLLSVSALSDSLQNDTALSSCMLVNNETGVIQNIPALAAACDEKQVILHVDAVQGLGKVPIDCKRWNVGMMSFSAHKLGGPKGVGALYLRPRPAVRVHPLVYGGGQERGLRSGTVALHQVVGLVRAAELAVAQREQHFQHLSGLRKAMRAAFKEALPEIHFNESASQQSPHILNVSFEGVDGEALRADLDQLAVSSGSACTSAQAESSYVLRAMGRSDALANASLRFSFGYESSPHDVLTAAKQVIQSVRRLRALSPLWEQAAP